MLNAKLFITINPGNYTLFIFDNIMRISLITAFYKDIVALKFIIESLKLQDYDDFELIVAEDNCDPEIEKYLSTITEINIVHTKQEDIGIRKARSINNAILKSTGNYLIFIDADCIPYHTFVSSHVKLAERNHVLSGRRVNLGPRVSTMLRNNQLSAATLEKFYLPIMPLLIFDGTTHLDQGIALDPDGFLYRRIISKRKKTNVSLLGCNFSCFKEDMLAINGFDEYYLGESCLADDTDLNWRFATYGLKFKSCKMASNLFHLYHGARPHRPIDSAAELSKMYARIEKNDYVAEIGLNSHSTDTK